MQDPGRNKFERDGFKLSQVSDYEKLKKFDCDNKDLNDYFREDIIKYHSELLSQAYMIQRATKGNDFPVALIDLCNDAVRHDKFKIETPIDKKTVEEKTKTYPAVKITRFGVQKEFQRLNIGTHVINMVKELFLTGNRTGCRLITVDAYRNDNALNFYQKNGFDFFTEKDKDRNTRSMFFDLKRFTL
ncbi:MAG: GNAT family N-acetyltransferase [Desulfobacterales bacterium]|nr:GNAT family N-acetyltransferase [Desulfobacterales bacterium]